MEDFKYMAAIAIAGMLIIGSLIVCGLWISHEEAMSHITAGHVRDAHGDWVKP